MRIALLEGSLDIAGLLLDNAADIDYVDTDFRSTLYIMALENDVKSVEFLLNHGESWKRTGHASLTLQLQEPTLS